MLAAAMKTQISSVAPCLDGLARRRNARADDDNMMTLARSPTQPTRGSASPQGATRLSLQPLFAAKPLSRHPCITVEASAVVCVFKELKPIFTRTCVVLQELLRMEAVGVGGNVRGSPLQIKRSNDSSLNSTSISSDSEHTEIRQQPSPAPQNPFDLITGDRSVSSDRSRNYSSVPDSPHRSGPVPLFVTSSPATTHLMKPGPSPVNITNSRLATPTKQDQLAQQQQTHGAASLQQFPPAAIQPRVLPYDLQQHQQPSLQQRNMMTQQPPPLNVTGTTNSLQQPLQPQYSSFNMSSQQQQQPTFAVLDDADGDTEPSSQPSSHERSITSNKTTFARLLNSKRRKQSEHDDDEEDALNDGALIYGYLQKLGRNGKWQSRWFESDGECLSYYKSDKRTKLLATLDLEKVRTGKELSNSTILVVADGMIFAHFCNTFFEQQVGSIEINPDDPQGCCFGIEVLGRDYHLRAESRASCRDWVITLNRVKEARLQQGNVKLVTPQSNPLNPQTNRDMTPRVVVVSNRERTRAVDAEDQWDGMMNSASGEPATVGNLDPSKRRSALQTVVLARWSKRNSSVSRLAAKLARWARSLQKYSCQGDADDVQLDRHVHPPGHDDNRARKHSKDDLSGLYGESQSSSNPALPHESPNKPIRNARAFSIASEDDSRMLA
jgi:hypothetical protein